LTIGPGFRKAGLRSYLPTTRAAQHKRLVCGRMGTGEKGCYGPRTWRRAFDVVCIWPIRLGGHSRLILTASGLGRGVAYATAVVSLLRRMACIPRMRMGPSKCSRLRLFCTYVRRRRDRDSDLLVMVIRQYSSAVSVVGRREGGILREGQGPHPNPPQHRLSAN